MADIDEALVEKAAQALRDADDEALTRTNFGQLIADYDESARAVLTAVLPDVQEHLNDIIAENDGLRARLAVQNAPVVDSEPVVAALVLRDPRLEPTHVRRALRLLVESGRLREEADVRRQVAEAVLALADEMENPNTEHGTMPGVRMQVRQHWAGRIRDAVERSDEEPCAEFGSHPRGAHARIAREVAP